jgi:hypothetical protein
MILNNAPQNEAIISNVSEIGEFRIRNSAKAFSILSSGLYANKIRAIIRELSCNAVDSHTAAGKAGVPFDVHLPNQLEPWFSIRDYGTGLSHEQVTNIYTTYFESTKTNSNEFIGALGLGSKSPFSYTDNFTVTAVQNGKKGIYSAFINGEGVPSIALMMSEDTEDANGVEIKFSVNSYSDFDKFRQEARIVYKHFSLRPVVSGNGDFGFVDYEYESKDIIPGVHSVKDKNGGYAVMGNIAYPIEIPQADQSLGELRSLLTCGLEMHFGIGELDFQASREGLSYIPSTVAAIKTKLEALNSALTVVLAKEADAIANLWDRACFLAKKKDQRLWQNAVTQYATNNPIPTFNTDRGYHRTAKFELKITELATTYNIAIRGVNKSRHAKTCSNLKPVLEYGSKKADGHYETWQEWHIAVDTESHFIINDLKTGASERVRYHYKETPAKDTNHYSRNIWILEKVDKTKDMDTAGFFAAIHQPPEARRFLASSLLQKPRESMGKNVTILSLQRRGGSGYRRSDDDFVWRDAGKADSFDDKTTHYYVPLSGFTMQSNKGYTSGQELYEDVKCLPSLFKGTIYGVRKGDIEDIKKRPNWKNFEDHIATQLNGKDVSKLLLSLVKSRLDNADILNYTSNKEILELINIESPYAKLVSGFLEVEKFSGNTYNLERLFRRFAPNANLSPDALATKYNTELATVNRRYPLLNKMNTYRIYAGDIAEYINLIDEKKGI